MRRGGQRKPLRRQAVVSTGPPRAFPVAAPRGRQPPPSACPAPKADQLHHGLFRRQDHSLAGMAGRRPASVYASPPDHDDTDDDEHNDTDDPDCDDDETTAKTTTATVTATATASRPPPPKGQDGNASPSRQGVPGSHGGRQQGSGPRRPPVGPGTYGGSWLGPLVRCLPVVREPGQKEIKVVRVLLRRSPAVIGGWLAHGLALSVCP